jgi:hypothetical protein
LQQCDDLKNQLAERSNIAGELNILEPDCGLSDRVD